MLIRLLGLIGVQTDDGRSPRLLSAQAQVALARLALDGEMGTSRHTLADTLWPAGLPDTWGSAQRSVISRVRRFLRDNGAAAADVESVNGRYVLRLPAEVDIDVERATRLHRAAEGAHAAQDWAGALESADAAAQLLRDAFLPDHDGEWVGQTRTRLAAELVSALEFASGAGRRLGRCHAAIETAQEAVRRAPLRESAHRCLIEAHAAAGNRAEALAAYQVLRNGLADELGVDPSAETVALHVALLGAALPSALPPGSPAERHRRPARLGGPAVATARGPSHSFVGRRKELATFAAAWSQVRAEGGRRMILITGERGIGKTQLLGEAVARLAGPEVLVLTGRGPGTAPPGGRSGYAHFHPVVEALIEYRDQGSEALPDSSGQAIALAQEVRVESADIESVRTDAARALHRAVLELAGDRPVLLVLDDLDGAAGTWTVLRRLLERGPRGGLLVLGACAETTPDPDLDSDRRGLQHAGQLERIVLRGLGQGEIFRLVAGLVADVDARSRVRTHQLRRDTGGNPHLLREVIRCSAALGAGEIDDEIPIGVADYARMRQAELTEPALQLMQVAAVAGESFEVDLLAEAIDMPGESALDALDELVARGLVEELADGRESRAHQLRHQLLRRAVNAELNPSRRQRLHARLADVIERRRAPELRRYVHEVARHRSLATLTRPNEQAVRSVWQAARQAQSDGALSDALRLYGQALDHVPAHDLGLRAEALTELGLAQLAKRSGRARQTLLDAAVTALSVGRLDLGARAGVGLSDCSPARPGPDSEVSAVLDALLEEAGSVDAFGDGSSDSGLVAGRLLVRASLRGGRSLPGPMVSEALRAMLRELDRGVDLRDLDSRRQLAEETLQLAQATGADAAARLAAHHAAGSAALSGAHDAEMRAAGVLAAPLPGGEPTGAERAVFERMAAIAVREGRSADARRIAPLAVGAPDSGVWKALLSPSMIGRQLLVDHWLRGISGAAAAPTDLGPQDQCLADLLAGRRGRVQLRVRAMTLGVEPLPEGALWMHAVGVLALCVVQLNDVESAERLLGTCAPYAGLWCRAGYRSDVAPMALHLGRLAMLVGEWRDAERHLRAALPQLAAVGARPWLAIALHDLAHTLDRRGAPDSPWLPQALRRDAGLAHRELGVSVADAT